MHIEDQQLLLLQTDQTCKTLLIFSQILALLSGGVTVNAFRQVQFLSVLLIFQPKAGIAFFIMSKYCVVFCISTF